MKYLLMLRTTALALTLASAVTANPASADTTATGFFTSDHCSGAQGCTGSGQPGGFGSITVTDNDLGTATTVGTVSISITLNNDNYFVRSHDAAFAFNLIGNPLITYSLLSSGFEIVGGNNPQAAGVISMNGLGDFEYGVQKITSGASPPTLTSLSFTLMGLNLGLESFAELSTIPPGDTRAFMAIDIGSPNANGQTGVIDLTILPTPGQQCTNCAVPGPVVGAGIPGLMTMAMFGLNYWRRRRHNGGFAT